MLDLSIIIVNYKSKIKTAKCLAAIYAADLENVDFEVILVENASGDDLAEFKNYPNLKVVVSGRNLGMGGGNNLGTQAARGKFILILNPDTYVSRNSIKILLDYIKSHDDVYVVGPKLLNSDESLQYSCARFPKIYTPILRRTFLGDYFKTSRDSFMMTDFDHNEIKQVDWVMGSCLMIRREGWEGFDERYFMYFEDIDLCRRVSHMDKKVIYNPQAVMVHDHQRASAKYPWYFAVFKDKLARYHIVSWLKYFHKWKFK
jgi:hypothetical protein